MILGYPGAPKVITRALTRGGRRVRVRETSRSRAGAVKGEEGTMSPGLQAPGKLEKTGNGFSVSGRNQPCRHLTLGLLELQDKKCVCSTSLRL